MLYALNIAFIAEENGLMDAFLSSASHSLRFSIYFKLSEKRINVFKKNR